MSWDGVFMPGFRAGPIGGSVIRRAVALVLSFLLLEDGSSFLLLEDGSSRLILE